MLKCLVETWLKTSVFDDLGCLCPVYRAHTQNRNLTDREEIFSAPLNVAIIDNIWCFSFLLCMLNTLLSDKSFPREVDAVLKFLKKQCGAKHIGAVGFCWGGIAVHYLALQYPEVKAGVSVYGMALHVICGKTCSS